MKIDLTVHATDKTKSYILAQTGGRMIALCGAKVWRANIVSASNPSDVASLTCERCKAVLQHALDAAATTPRSAGRPCY